MKKRILFVGTLVLLLGMMLQLNQAQAKKKSKAVLFISSFDRQIDLTDGKSWKLNIRCLGKNIAKKAKYKITNKKVCTIKKGKVTAKKEGTAKVTVTYKGGKEKFKVVVVNSHYQRDAKAFLANCKDDYYAEVPAMPNSEGFKFNMLVTCKKGAQYQGEADEYTVWRYCYNYNTKKKKHNYAFYKERSFVISYRTANGVPKVDYNTKLGLFYSMSYSKPTVYSPLEPIAVNIVCVTDYGEYGEKIVHEENGLYTGNTINMVVSEESQGKDFSFNYFDKTYYLHNNCLKRYQRVYANRTSKVLIPNNAGNRNKIK